VRYRALGRTGLDVSVLGFGASSLGGVFRDIDPVDARRTVHLAIERGVNFIDVSPYYGLTKAETVLGQALKTVERDKYLLATKIGRYGPHVSDFDFSAKGTFASIDQSLKRLGVDHVDLLQAHDIEFGTLEQIINETVPALQQIKQSGKARFVGITGLPLAALKHVAERVEVDTVLSYCHYTLNDTSFMDLVPLLKRRRLGIINAAPLAMGLLSSSPLPNWHPAPPALRDKAAQAAALCKARGSSIEKLAVQFAVQAPDIASTIVGTAESTLMELNIRWIDEPIDITLLREVQSIFEPVHNLSWISGRPENNGDVKTGGIGIAPLGEEPSRESLS
jgi:L-galactose dehydrogenase